MLNNKFEKALSKFINIENIKKIQSCKIGLAGAGGLGSNCAFNLVRCGFTSFTIVDFDKVEISNLNRQFYFQNQIGMKKIKALEQNLKKINPDLDISIFYERLNKNNIEKFFVDCQVIIEALDDIYAKMMLVKKYLNDSRLLVTASGLAGWGESDRIKVRKINDNTFLIGDCQSEASKKLPPFSPLVNIAAAKQADIVLSYVLGYRR